MCGIAGFLDFKNVSDDGILKAMNNTFSHRGPDGEGTMCLKMEKFVLGFAHRRLAIIDLSPGGHQPMKYKSLSITFNGEVYNFLEIRRELELLGHSFQTKSDTEVILHAYDQWGDQCLSRFIGMFAFSIFDENKQELFLVRDRAGVKPLYYYWKDGLFLFGSELKTFHAHPLFNKEINLQSVYAYMDYGYIPSPLSIFKNSFKLPAGHFLKFDIKKSTFSITKYWDVKDFYLQPIMEISYEEAKRKIHDLLISAYNYRMISDVPVGVFLSGGYDSTSVAAILQKSLGESNTLQTFSIGFEEGNNEAPFAKIIANYLGTKHTEYYCTTKEAQEIISKLPFYFDEPFSDSSAIPTILVSRLARKSVTVALSADGGDETFAGYSIYESFSRRLNQLQRIPLFLRKSTSFLSKIASNALPLKFDNAKHKLDVLSRVIENNPNNLSQALYREYFMLGRHLKSKLFNQVCESFISEYNSDYSSFKNPVSMAQAIDYKMYMQDDILTKVDRATMSVSLEGREPLLDHRIIEFVARLPLEFKLGGTSKIILKDIVHEYVPKNIMDRPKTGFSIPLELWLKNDLKYLADKFLSQSELEKSGVFNVEFVLNLKKSFYNNTFNDATFIWKLIQYQMWSNQWMA